MICKSRSRYSSEIERLTRTLGYYEPGRLNTASRAVAASISLV